MSVNKYKKFWDWFLRNEQILFEQKEKSEHISDRLIKELNNIHPELCFEFSPEIKGKREFTISAGGVLEAFPEVTELWSYRPKLPRWIIQRFRQRMQMANFEDYGLSYAGISLKFNEIHYLLTNDCPRIGVDLFIPEYHSEKETIFRMYAYLVLDSTLGEYDVETKVSFIQLHPFVKEKMKDLESLGSMAKKFDILYNTIIRER